VILLTYTLAKFKILHLSPVSSIDLWIIFFVIVGGLLSEKLVIKLLKK